MQRLIYKTGVEKMKWWTDWFVPLLVASGVLLIFNGGFVLTAVLWAMYLLNGWKTVKKIPSQENYDEFATQLIIGIIVVVVSIVIVISAHIRY